MGAEATFIGSEPACTLRTAYFKLELKKVMESKRYGIACHRINKPITRANCNRKTIGAFVWLKKYDLKILSGFVTRQ